MGNELSEDAFDELLERCDLHERQVAFLIEVWSKRDFNYPTLARAVSRDIREDINLARRVSESSSRREMLHALDRLRSVISYLDEHHYVIDRWSGSTSRHGGKVSNVVPGGLPGLGK